MKDEKGPALGPANHDAKAGESLTVEFGRHPASTPKPGDYGWGKNRRGVIALGPVVENVRVSTGWFKSKTIPLAIYDKNAGRVLDVNYLTEWHPLGEDTRRG